MSRVTIDAVDRALSRAGHAERLFRGKGYFYFSDGEAHRWPSSSVLVPRVSDLTVGEWLDRHAELRAAWEDTRRDLADFKRGIKQ